MFLFGCSKDSPSDQTLTDVSTVYRYQAVTINLPNTVLDATEYEATFGNQPIKLLKIDANTLGFSVPFDADLGNVELSILSLQNTIKYNVLMPVLPQTADETITQFTTLGDNYIANHPETESNNNYEKFKSFYANHATAEQKEKMALCYYVNKDAFDALILFDPENPSGRFTDSDELLMGKFLLAVGAGGASVWIMYSQIPADPAGAILAAGATYFFYAKAKNYGSQIAELDTIKTVGLSIGGLVGVNNRGVANNAISLTSDVAVELPFNLKERALTQGDNTTTSQTVSSFFDKLVYMNDFITKTNTAIVWINNNIPLVNFSPFESILLQTNPTIVDTNTDNEAMQNISFSVNNPNLQLVNASLSVTGQLNLRVKVVGTPSQLPVVSTLNYAYSDELTSFQGSFNIEVASEPLVSLIGNWQIVGVGADNEYNAATGIYNSYITSVSETGNCAGLQTYDSNYTTSFNVSNVVSFTASSLNMSFSRQTSGQFCDAAYGEAQCSFVDNYTFTSVLTSSPSIQLNGTKSINTNYINQENRTCTDYVSTFGPCNIPSCQGYTTNNENISNPSILVKMKGETNIIYIDFTGLGLNQIKLVRQ
jgi:hypothetical protein